MSMYGVPRASFLATVRACKCADELAPHTRREIEEADEDLHQHRVNGMTMAEHRSAQEGRA